MKSILSIFLLSAGLLLGQAQQTNSNGANIDTAPERTAFKTALELENVDNTADADKPISTLIQAALDLKSPLASPTFTGTVTLPSTSAIGTVSSTELGYLDGVTSALQTQLNAKVGTTGNETIAGNKTFSGSMNITSPNLTVSGTAGNTLNVTSSTIDYVGFRMQNANQSWLYQIDAPSANFRVVNETTGSVPWYIGAGDFVYQSGLRMRGTDYSNTIYQSNAGALSISTVNDSYPVNLGNGSSDPTLTAIADKVGILNTSPTEALDVTGNIKASGTITSGGSAVVLATGSQTIAGNKTLSGQTELTGQAATNSTSAVNVGMVNDLFMADHTSREWSIFGMANTNVGWGSYATYLPSEAKIFVASAVTGSSCHVRANPNASGMPFVAGGDQNSIDWSKRIRISFMCYFAYSDADTVTRFQVGEDCAKTTISDLDQKGFGFKKTNTNISVLAHNGTTLTTLAAGTVTDGTHLILMESDGAGNVKLYIDGTLVQTATGGATTLGSYVKSAVNFSVDNGTGTGTPHFDLYGTIKVKIGN